MAEYKHGEMDIKVQEDTFDGFMRFVTWSVVAILVLVVLMPLGGTPMAGVAPPPLEEVGAFFELARAALPDTPVMLGCARPLGEQKLAIDRLAVDAGLNGIAYPAEGVVAYAEGKGLEPTFVDACCGVSW